MRTISIDPGVTTGYCYAEITLSDGLKYCPFQSQDGVEVLYDKLHKFKPDFIIMEDFAFRQGSQKTGVNLFPVQLLGIARLYTEWHPDARLFLQTAAEGKGYYTDAILKKDNLYRKGIGHGMDASRHLLHWTNFGFGFQFKVQTISIVEMSYFND